MDALLWDSRLGAHVEAKNDNKLLCSEDLRGFKREKVSTLEGFRYAALVAHEKYQKRKERAPAPYCRLAGPPFHPRRPRCGVSSRKWHPPRRYLWHEVEESAAGTEEPSRTRSRRPQERPRREDRHGPSKTQRPMRPPQKKPKKKYPQRFHPRELLPEPRDWIEQRLGGTDLLPVCQKTLTATDVSPHHRRLLIPMDRMVSLAFLKEKERVTVERPSTVGLERGVDVRVISHPSLQQRMPSFRKWIMKKANGTASEMYVLTTSDWVGVVKDNNLKAGGVIQIWSYRVEGQLHMLVLTVGEAAKPLEDGN